MAQGKSGTATNAVTAGEGPLAVAATKPSASSGISIPPALWYLVPPIAGLCVALAVNAVLTSDALLFTLWPGVNVNDAWSAHGAGLKAAGVVFGIVLWLICASVVARGEGVRAAALRRAAPGFLPFLSILALNAADGYTGADMMYWSVLAAVLSFGFLAAWTASARLAAGKWPAARSLHASGRRAFGPALAMAAAYAAISIAMALLQYRALRISYHDTAGFDEMLWRTLHGQFLRASCFDRSFLGQHFEFIQLFLLPVYVIWPGLRILMIIQAVALASGVVPVFLLARDKLKYRTAALLFAAAYLLYAPMQYAEKRIIYETYLPETMAIPALLWALYFLEKGRMWRLALAGFLAAACKEDMALPIAMMGVVLMIRRRWAWGAGFFVVASAWFIVSLSVIIPYFEGGPSHVLSVGYYSSFGYSTGEVMRNIFADPLAALAHMLQPKRMDFLLMMLVPMGMLAALSPTAVIVFLPSIASNLLASWEPSSTILYHYHISLVPFAVGGAILGAANVVRVAPELSYLWGGVSKEQRRAASALFCGVLVLSASFLGDVLYGKWPWSLRFYNSRSTACWRHIYVKGGRAEQIDYFDRTVFAMIPRDAKVSSSQYLATRFTHHGAAWVYPRGAEKADYIVIERKEPDNPSLVYSVSPVDVDGSLSRGFETLVDGHGFLVLKRTESGSPRPAVNAPRQVEPEDREP